MFEIFESLVNFLNDVSLVVSLLQELKYSFNSSLWNNRLSHLLNFIKLTIRKTTGGYILWKSEPYVLLDTRNVF